MKAAPLVLALLLVSSLVRAHELHLTAGDCASAHPAIPHALVFNCTSNASPSVDIIGSVRLSAPIPHIDAFGAVVDFQTQSASVPDWWRFDAGGCHAGYATGTIDQPAAGSCTALAYVPIAAGHLAVGLDYWAANFNGSNRIRYQIALGIDGAVDVPQVDPVLGLDEWGVFRLRISFADKTVGAGACAGCTTGVCAVFSSMTFDDGGIPLQIASANDTGQWVSFNAGGPSCPAATPTHNSTWGAIKSQYR